MVTYMDKAGWENGEVDAGQTPVVWYHSLFWKLTVFVLASVVLAYTVGAAIGWLMVARDSMEQWRRQAEMNAQVTSSAVRSIYTFVAIDSAPDGQITKIISERPLGDDASILDTGFNPSDVLGLAASQTKNNIWLFQKPSDTSPFVSSAEAFASQEQTTLTLPKDNDPSLFFIGFADIGAVRHFIAYVPIVTPQGVLQGGIVSTIGEDTVLQQNQTRLLHNSLVVLITILVLTGTVVGVIMTKIFRPVPSLIRALSSIARDDTRSVTPFQDRHDEIGRFAVAIEVVREAVAEREHLRQMRDVAKQMEHLAHHDALTGLPNRMLFHKRLEETLALKGHEELRFNLMLLDLDRFKSINDGLGHASGDALLVSFAERISFLLKPGDVAARLGGDEFALLQIVSKDAVAEAGKLASAIIRSVSRPFVLLGKEVSVSASIGICTHSQSDGDVTDLLKKTDIALYSAKSEGRAMYRFFKDGMEMSGERGHVLQHDLDVALKNDEFELHYQPIFSVSRSVPAGFEALLRWRHPKLGWICPNDFIPVAEKSGQIVAIGEWVLNRACKDAADLPPETFVAINVSPIQLRESNLLDRVKLALHDNALPASRLELEITETAQVSTVECLATLEGLRELGVGIALDDFGTGYSGISYLITLPVTKIKIDRSFVSGIGARADSEAIVTNLLRLASSLGLQTTAEGIETKQELEFLQALGCGLGQGFYLGRPAAIADIQSGFKDLNVEKVS